MNPLTQIKWIQNINAKESDLGISEDASWHAKYKNSAYIYVGGLALDLTEGDILAVFAQYGEVVDVDLIRDKGTGKSKGFAFLAYEDQRLAILAVDNLNGAQVLGRQIKVDHCRKLKRRDGRTERHLVCAELFREESVLVEILANFPTTRKELQILVGVMKRIEVPSGIMTSSMVPRRVVVQVLAIEEISNLMRKRKLTEERVM